MAHRIAGTSDADRLHAFSGEIRALNQYIGQGLPRDAALAMLLKEWSRA